MSTDNLSEAEAGEILRNFNESKQTVHSFFTNIIKADDTTKVGNLSTDELGISKLPVRTYKELALFSKDIAEDESFSDYFNKMSEIQTSSSLSKDGTLIRLSVTSKKELADLTPQKKENKGWFKSKDNNNETV